MYDCRYWCFSIYIYVHISRTRNEIQSKYFFSSRFLYVLLSFVYFAQMRVISQRSTSTLSSHHTFVLNFYFYTLFQLIFIYLLICFLFSSIVLQQFQYLFEPYLCVIGLHCHTSVPYSPFCVFSIRFLYARGQLHSLSLKPFLHGDFAMVYCTRLSCRWKIFE